MATIPSSSGNVLIRNHPDECPFCHSKITPVNIYGYKIGNGMDVLQFCPNTYCQKTFIAYYTYNNNTGNFHFDNKTTQGTIAKKDFSETIISISESFVTIYNQAFSAEQQNLTEICGVGYRKALEFLIKDYLIFNNPELKEKVEKKLLGACIAEFVSDTRVKTVSKRAVWLGNDETHYIRKWEGRNLEDLKKLIELTVHWVEMEHLTKSFEENMPE
jgi:hypothetical protein